MPRLPPLNALIGFEAAARLGSFSKAADELNLTQSTVSHQIKLVEQVLGQPLFRRSHRRAVLTDAGADFLRTVHGVIEGLQAGIARLEPYRKPGSVVLYAPNAFALGWLLPRLTGFRRAHPRVDIWLDSSGRAVDFERDEVDVLIRRGIQRDPEVVSETLLQEVLVPVGAPALLDGAAPPATPAGLAGHVLLHEERTEDWQRWFDAAGLPGQARHAGPNFSDGGVLLEAAALGHGVALGSTVLADRLLREGRLRPLFGPVLPVDDPYCLAYRPSSLRDDDIRTVCDWLRAQAATWRQTTAPALPPGSEPG